MNTPKIITMDVKRITNLYYADGRFALGVNGVTEIVPYIEVDNRLWFAIYKGDFLDARASSDGVTVSYGKAWDQDIPGAEKADSPKNAG